VVGKTVSHYRILEKLGEGGMGVVYKSLDTKLERLVALKFLSPELTRDADAKKRFIQEAQSASALDHPNICTVHEIDETEGQTFIVMACVEGETLRQKISSGPLKLEEAVDIAIQIAQGLQEAHERGIVHRDIKSSNIMVTPKSQVKIMDFGLAKLVTGPRVTKTGATVGTAAYMSPEQAQGLAVDRRTDIWSLGVVLYEMLTGRLPFSGEYYQAVIYRILNEAPEPITSLRAGVPMELERIVGKALEKDPKRRYQQVDDFLVDLRNFSDRTLTERGAARQPAASQEQSTSAGPAFGAPGSPSDRVSGRRVRRLLIPVLIVVLAILAIAIGLRIQVGRQPAAVAEENTLAIMYFNNLAEPGDPDKLGEIATDLLITGLSESRYVQVVSSQRLYDLLKLLGREGEKSINKEVASQVATKANAKWMLTGNILQEKPEIVLTAQLVETASGKVVASHKITSNPGEKIFPVIDKLAAAVKEDLSLPSAAREEIRPPIADITSNSEEAYRYFLEGWDLTRKFYYEDARIAFRKAVALDSTLAFGYYMLSIVGDPAEREGMIAKAVEYSNHASELQRFYIRAQEAELAGEFAREVSVLKKLLERYPLEKAAYALLGNAYGGLGYPYGGLDQPEEGIQCYERAIQIDPLYKEAYNWLAYAYDATGNFDKSIWAIDKYISLAPEEANPYDSKGDLYAWNGHLEEAIASYRKALEVKPDFYGSLQKLAALYTYKREYDRAEECCERLAASSSRDARSFGRWILGAIYAYRGKLDMALQVLDEGLSADRMEKVATSPNAFKHEIKAFIYLEKKNPDLVVKEAKKYWESMNGNRSDFPTNARDEYSYLLAASGNISQAQEVAGSLKRDLAAGNKAAAQMQGYWRAVGAIELAKGNWQAAAGDFEKGLVGVPASGNPWRVLLGEAYLEMDRRAEAVDVLERVVSSYPVPGNPILAVKAHYLLGLAYEKSGWREKAVEQYQEFLEIWKEADPGISEIVDAKARLAQLKRGG